MLLTYEDFEKLTGGGATIGELMYMPGVADIELEIRPRADDYSRDVDFS